MEKGRFCANCGKEIQDGKPCGCADEIADLPDLDESRQLDIKGVVKINASNEDKATVAIAGKVLKATVLLKVAFVLLLLALFFPFENFRSYMGGSGSLSGWTIILGTTAAQPIGLVGMSAISVVTMHLLWMIPVVGFISLQMQKLRNFLKGKLYIYLVFMYALGLVSLINLGRVVADLFSGPLGERSSSIGFYLSFIVYTLGLIISVGCLLAFKRK